MDRGAWQSTVQRIAKSWTWLGNWAHLSNRSSVSLSEKNGNKKSLPFGPVEQRRFHRWIASQVAQMVKHLPAVWEICVWSPGWEDALEKEMATHSSTPAWKIPWMEEPGRLQSMGLQRVRHDWATSLTMIGTWCVCSKHLSLDMGGSSCVY